MATDMGTIAGALKQVYDDYVEKQQNLTHRAIDEIAKGLQKYNPGGQGFYGAINDKGNESVGAITENETFRTIDNENYIQWVVKPKVLVAPIQFSGLASKAAAGDEESFVNTIVDALDTAKERLLKDENRQFFGSGTGHLAFPAGTVSSLATSFSVDNAQYLRANMVIDSYAGTTAVATGVRIVDVDRVANVVYLSAAVGTALASTNDLIKQNIRAGSAPADGKETMGLQGITDDSTLLQTFQGIDSSANRIWRGRNIATGSVNLTSDLLQRLIDDVAVMSGEEPDTLIMHKKQRRKYLDLVIPQKRYEAGDTMDAGFKKLEFNGTELWIDLDCQVDTVYAIKKSYIRKFEVEAMSMGNHEGSDKFLRLVNADLFQAYWRHYVNYGTSKRNAHGKLTGLATPAGIS